MKKSALILFAVLTISMVVGIALDKFIIELLFQRGAFTSEDTIKHCTNFKNVFNRTFAFWLSKIFSLWLYAKEQQILTAKISAQSLVANIIFSLILIKPFGAAGFSFFRNTKWFCTIFSYFKSFWF